MPTRGKKFINEFLIPNLNEETFGSRLKWLNIEKAVFQLQWNHKSGSDWKTTDAEVFIEWDKKKGHYRPDEKDYYTKSKQRFRAVLYKLIREHLVTEICSKDKGTKIYCIGKREKYELENMSFKFHSSPSYSVQHPIESIIEDHKYSQSEQSISENEEDMLSLYPTQPFSYYSSSKVTCQKIESGSTVDMKPFHNHQFAPSDQPPLSEDSFTLSKNSMKAASLNMEDFSLHQQIEENSNTYEAGALSNTSLESSNFLDEFSNYLQNFLQEMNC